MTTPYEVVLEHAETVPGRTALTFGDARWSYADLAEQAGRVAGGLRDIGLGRGDRLAVLAGNRPEVAVAWLAGSRSGVQPLPAQQPVPPRNRAARHRRLRRDKPRSTPRLTCASTGTYGRATCCTPVKHQATAGRRPGAEEAC